MMTDAATVTDLSIMLERGLYTPRFLRLAQMDAAEMEQLLAQVDNTVLARTVLDCTDENGRFLPQAVLDGVRPLLPVLQDEPACGWLKYCYYYVLTQIYPENAGSWRDADIAEIIGRDQHYRRGRCLFMQLLRALFRYERQTLPFDPTWELAFLAPEEIEDNGDDKEYLRLRELSTELYAYEFMRLGIALTPFHTLGHIGGVHYVAVYAARQLRRAGVGVDVGLVSGAAACHDIGKYGCRKCEERRVPYLHYYYTDLCCRRVGLPTIGHIAANHSVWDLELENLPVEALLLIYADFRVKSTRADDGREIIHFYSLAEAFDVILGKLDNVDEKKRSRYQKVYAKLADFEAYMTEWGVVTELPADFAASPAETRPRRQRDAALLDGTDVVDALKYAAIGHNIRLMRLFRDENAFTGLIEAVRSERNWKNVRTYISIFEEYSTYMTEQQKLLTLQYLYEALAYKEIDIRMQAARLMGTLVAGFNETYSKELPEGVSLPPKEVTGLSLFAHYVSLITKPGWRFTAQHKSWISYCLGSFVRAVLESCDDKERLAYMRLLQPYYTRTNYRAELYIVLLTALMEMDSAFFDEEFLPVIAAFIAAAAAGEELSLRVAALRCGTYIFDRQERDDYRQRLLRVLDLPQDDEDLGEREGALFLDNLKTGTHWIIKVSNMETMIRHLERSDKAAVMHLGTHLANVLKVSDNPFVRRTAGEALLQVAEKMTYTQRNEIVVELFNGLELGDLRISKYVPEYLGEIILRLLPQEFDECILSMEQQLLTANTQVAASMVHTIGVILGSFDTFAGRQRETYAGEHEKRQRRLLYLMIKAYAHYDTELSRDAFRYIGRFIFNNPKLAAERVDFLFIHSYKKLLVTLTENREGPLDFYSNAAVLNHIYRYIGSHQFRCGDFELPKRQKVCLYPGTFDPFSLGHKAVAEKIRDLGFEVYLALDEFSWSKHTQPRLMRRKIMDMSTADQEDMYLFPDDIPINLTNAADMRRLKELFRGKDVYLAVGTDVIENASAYKARPTLDSVHMMNHIAFARETRESRYSTGKKENYPIQGKVITLLLDKFYEDISSTRIRENIDLNRDISNLIDAVAQNFIYENNLYLREPAYKHVVEAKDMGIGSFKQRGRESLWPLRETLLADGYDTSLVENYIESDTVRTLYIDSAGQSKEMVAYAAVHRIGARSLLTEFGDPTLTAHIRDTADGSIAAIGFLYARENGAIANMGEIIITEIMTELIARDFAYAVYHPVDGAGYRPAIITALRKQGFVNIAPAGAAMPVYAVSLKAPVVLFRDVETVIKAPFNKNPRVLQALDRAHHNLLAVMRRLYPGKLILSFNTSIVHNKIIKKAVELNGVSPVRDNERRYGPYMSVPFGKTLSSVLIPNTVTKALHIEKYFNRYVKGFTIAESHQYSSVDNQLRTIKSFNRPVILIDDLLHKGYRMQMLTPVLERNQIEVKTVLVGVITGRAVDMMAARKLNADAAYFLPTLEIWFNERDCYPFLGGDSIDNAGDYSSYGRNPSINLVLPYVKPGFIGHGDDDAAFAYSLTCLENARAIMETLQEEYQKNYEKKLTLKRLGEVLTAVRIPDIDVGVRFDENMAPTRFIENDLERLKRLRWGSSRAQRSGIRTPGKEEV